MTAAPPPAYAETIETEGLRVPFVPGIVTPAIERPMRRGRYEAGERAALRAVLRPGDRVLDLGAGLGLVSAEAALAPGVEAVTAVEANPDLLPLIRETWAINGARARLLNAVVGTEGGGEAAFYLRRDFWASSMEPGSRPYERSVAVPRAALADLLAETRATVISCDLEGGEAGLFDAVDLSGVRAVVMELHPKVYGPEGVQAIRHRLEGAGLRLQPVEKATTVRTFLRPDPRPGPAPGAAAPRVLIVTCMKDEGPFIVEWVAWHRAMGVTDIVVFTNDLTDGSAHLLDRLDEMGVLRHLPNPALATGSTYFQPAALAVVPHLPEARRAGFLISIDVDEFLNVRVGDGSLSALFERVGHFDALSVSELNHGANGQAGFAPGRVTRQFPRHETETPGRRKAVRGVKTIVRTGPKLMKARNHRPDFRGLPEDVTWLDGSGRPLRVFLEDPELNGHDVRGTYDLVSLDHFALRSLESYLVKMARGDVVIAGKRVSQRYWRMRNRNEHLTSRLDRQEDAFRAEHDRLMGDAAVAACHAATCAAHAARAAALLDLPDYAARRDWILANAWDEGD